MTLLLLIPVAWISLLAFVTALCVAASRGEETRDLLEAAPATLGRRSAHGMAFTDGAAAIHARQAQQAPQAPPAYEPAVARGAAGIAAA
jgi:hypothetical protein